MRESGCPPATVNVGGGKRSHQPRPREDSIPPHARMAMSPTTCRGRQCGQPALLPPLLSEKAGVQD